MSTILPPYPNPVTDIERFLYNLATGTGEFPLYPNPVTDMEKYLAYLCAIGFTARGYYYNGAFYADAQHTEELPKITGKLYYDNQSGTLYIYDGTQYSPVGGGGSGVVKGYYYNGAFYADAQYTELITPEEGGIYYDRTGGKLYKYNGSAYSEIGGMPAVTSSDAGKFARVNDSGEWVAESVPEFTGGSY